MKYILPAILLIAVVLRVFIPMHDVFAGEYINFIGPDSYYHMDIAKQVYDDTLAINVSTLYPKIIIGFAWLVSFGQSSWRVIETAATFLPVVFAIFTIIFVYIIGRRLFSNTVGLCAAAFIAVFPGEYFSRTLLGHVDHHAAEVFFTTGAACLCVFILTSKRIWVKLLALSGAVGLTVALYFTWHGFTYFVQSIFSFSNPFAMQPGITLQATQEAMNILETPNFTPILDILLSAVFLVILLKYAWNWRGWLLGAWCIFMVGATAWQVRFEYYLIVPLSLLFGFTGKILIDDWENKVYKKLKVVLISLAVIILLLPITDAFRVYYIVQPNKYLSTLAQGTTSSVPSEDWNDALVWIKQNTPVDALVIAWWDYGYWVRYRAERKPYVTPSQETERIKIISKALLDYTNSPVFPDGADYLIIDENTAINFNRGMALWGGLDYQDVMGDRTLAFRLYSGAIIPGITLVYGDKVKVFALGGRA